MYGDRFYMPRFNMNAMIFSNYIRYERLRELIINEFRGTEDEDCVNINIFIDLYSLIKNAHHRDDFAVDEEDKYALASGVINMAAHYRAFFNSRLGVNTKIFIISSFNNYKYLSAINPQYHSQVDLKGYKVDYFIKNISALSVIAPYLPNIYFKHYDYATSSAAIRDIMGFNVTHGNKNPNIIITKDILNYQLVNFQPARTIILRPKKVSDNQNSSDISYLINKHNLMRILLWERNKGKKTDPTTMEQRYQKISMISPELFSALLSIIGCHEYGYKSVISFPAAINVLYKIIIENQLLLNQYNYSPLDLFRLVEEYTKTKRNINIVELESRFRTIDTIYLYDQMQAINMELITKIPEDLYAPEMLKKINEKFFADNPLDLNVL